MTESQSERRARLMKAGRERISQLKEKTSSVDNFEAMQGRNFNSNFKQGGQDARPKTSRAKRSAPKSVQRTPKSTQRNSKSPQKNPRPATKTSAKKTAAGQVNLSVSTKKGEMVHHQRMLTMDVNAQATHRSSRE